MVSTRSSGKGTSKAPKQFDQNSIKNKIVKLEAAASANPKAAEMINAQVHIMEKQSGQLQQGTAGPKQDTAEKILALVQKEFESGDQDYYCVLHVRPEDLGTLDTACQDKLKNTYATILSAISTSADEKQKRDLSNFVLTAYNTLSNPEKKKQYDEQRSNVATLAMIRQEHASPNPNYYQLFQLKPPGQDLAPLTAEEKAKLEHVGANYIKVVQHSRVKDEEALLKFIKHAGDTLAVLDDKMQYDEERLRKNLEEMKGGGQMFQDADMEDWGGSKDDGGDEIEGPVDNQANGGPDEQLLLKLYDEATPILKQYLCQPDDPSKKPEELAMEKYAPLDQHNEKIVNTIGEAHRQESIIQYSYLKEIYRQISELERKIKSTSGSNTTALSNKLATIRRQVQKYLVEHHYPNDWALLFGAPIPDANFDTSKPAKWDALYHDFPRNPDRKDEIMIAWAKSVNFRTRIFVITPSGLDCRYNDPAYPSFKEQYPQYEYIFAENVRPYRDQRPILFMDAWSKGGRRIDDSLKPIYCVLQIGHQIRVATCSISHLLLRGTKEQALQRCKQRGITFLKALKSSRENAAAQQEGTNSPQDAEISDLKAQVGDLNSKLSEFTSMMGKFIMGGSVKSPAMAQ